MRSKTSNRVSVVKDTGQEILNLNLTPVWGNLSKAWGDWLDSLARYKATQRGSTEVWCQHNTIQMLEHNTSSIMQPEPMSKTNRLTVDVCVRFRKAVWCLVAQEHTLKPGGKPRTGFPPKWKQKSSSIDLGPDFLKYNKNYFLLFCKIYLLTAYRAGSYTATQCTASRRTFCSCQV